MKKAIAICAALITLAMLAAGCQATPEKPVVVQKDMEQMIEKGTATSASSQTDTPSQLGGPTAVPYAELCSRYGVPERFKSAITEGNLTINCDIAIELPNTIKLPMAKVEADKFSQEQVYTLFKALCGDKQMYIVPKNLDKAHYEEAILKYQALLSKATDEKVIKSLNSMIDDFKEQYEAAPETMDIVPSDGTLQTMDVRHEKTDAASGTQTYLETTSDPYSLQVMYSADTMPDAAQFTVYNDIDYNNTSGYSYVDEQGNTQIIAPRSGSRLIYQRSADLWYGLNGVQKEDVTELSLKGGALSDCLLAVTPRQARDVVEKLIAGTGMDDMAIDSAYLCSTKKDVPKDTEKDRYMEQMGAPDPAEQPEKQAYVFRLLRQLNGVKVESTQDSSETSVEGASYSKEWMYEALTVAVDDEGIANLFWTGPLNVTGIIAEDTTILPWSDIEDIFSKMIVIQNEGYSKNSESVSIDVTRASLSLQRIMERDSFTSGLLLPVWNFYGTMTLTNAMGDRNVIVMDEKYFPLISINAIDGSVIDPSQGY